MNILSVALAAFVLFSFALPVAVLPAFGAGEPTRQCLLLADSDSIVGEPAVAFRKVGTYGGSVLEATGPGRLVLGEADWSAYSITARVQIRRGHLLVQFLSGSEGHYTLRVQPSVLHLERADASGRVEELERAAKTLRPDRWSQLRIELAPSGPGDRILVWLDGEVIMGNPDETITAGKVAIVVPAGAQVRLADIQVESHCAAPKDGLPSGCAQARGEPKVLRGPVLEAEQSVGQWHTGEATYDISDFFNPPVPLKFQGAFTDATCLGATSTLRFHLSRAGVYYLMARLFSPGGRSHHDLVHVTIHNGAHQSLRSLDGDAHALVYGRGSGLVSLGAWRLDPGLYTLTFQADTRHLLVVDYFVLLPQTRLGSATLVMLPLSAGMNRDGWHNGTAALTIDSSTLTSTPGATTTVQLHIPGPGRYTLVLDTWYAGPRMPLRVSFQGDGRTEAWAIQPSWAEGVWATVSLGPLALPAGEASLSFTHEGTEETTTWAVDTILLIPEEPLTR